MLPHLLQPTWDNVAMAGPASSPEAAPQRLSVADLEAMQSAPDLTKRERKQLKREIRFQRRVETWEGRLQGPQPRKIHRAVISILMMLLCLFTLYVLLFGRAA
jgi:hypothetical protein